MIVVLDTSCISAFILTKRVNLLLEILSGNEVAITEQVENELKLGKATALKEFNHSKIKAKPAKSEIALKYGLHIGEASVIMLAKEYNALAVIDDKRARHAAENEKIQFIGTATLVKLAIERKSITKNEAVKLIQEITSAGKLFMSDEIKKWILENQF